MPDESIAVTSVDTESEPASPETPVATPVEPAPETPAEKVETVTPTEPVQELYELPDGRKVDAATLSKEWKENFYPDYTRKSQALATKEPQHINTPIDPYDDPNYVPPSYKSIKEDAVKEALALIEKREVEKIEQQKSIETAIENQLAEVRKIDPALNENALFLHANKYGFRDLKVAHQNMKDMSDAMKKVQETTVKNIAKRSDPVSVTPGGTGTRPEPSQFATAIDYLNALKASGK